MLLSRHSGMLSRRRVSEIHGLHRNDGIAGLSFSGFYQASWFHVLFCRLTTSFLGLRFYSS